MLLCFSIFYNLFIYLFILSYLLYFTWNVFQERQFQRELWRNVNVVGSKVYCFVLVFFFNIYVCLFVCLFYFIILLGTAPLLNIFYLIKKIFLEDIRQIDRYPLVIHMICNKYGWSGWSVTDILDPLHPIRLQKFYPDIWKCWISKHGYGWRIDRFEH